MRFTWVDVRLSMTLICFGAVDLDACKEQCGSSLPTSQACCVLAGFSFFLDALNDDKERRLAKEYIRSLGGQVRPDMLRGPYLVACW
jgi:hypothetical protein